MSSLMTTLSYKYIGSLYMSILYFSCEYPFSFRIALIHLYWLLNRSMIPYSHTHGSLYFEKYYHRFKYYGIPFILRIVDNKTLTIFK